MGADRLGSLPPADHGDLAPRPYRALIPYEHSWEGSLG